MGKSESSFKLLISDKSTKIDAMTNPKTMELSCFSWNIEGLRRNSHSLKHFTDLHRPDLIFLSEPQAFQCDVACTLKMFRGSYSHHLNSEDTYQPDPALEKSRAKGGTLLMWKSSLDQYVSVIPSTSPSVQALSLSIPNYPTSFHIGIYLQPVAKKHNLSPPCQAWTVAWMTFRKRMITHLFM